ncbi:long-chain fatty acid--CoA ligase [uncultured Thiodictyon sp.]|uniref:long-chain-fatty-acid--CoA ligase n=1 Tax=uncultured Thiodictyon sp. TaxID=1846217 RepID=UPI0025EABEEA|nr:long-chain fatty acid--CoA ligase [uncultured Thiodictyon sp.]
MTHTPIDLIPERFRRVAAARGDALCVFADTGNRSFADLDRASDGLAAALAARGLQMADRVGLLCINGADFVIAYLGILKAGATVVPLNLMLSPREMGYILADSGARGLIHHHTYHAAAVEACAGLDLALRVRIGEGDGAAALSCDALIGEGNQNPGGPPSLTADPAESVAAILYTSGTTGHPKGAMLTHRNLLNNAASVAQALGFSCEDRVLVVLPMFHAFAATVGMLTPLVQGCGLVPVPRFDPKAVTQAIATHGATIFLGVPSMYQVLLRLDDAALPAWGGVRVCVSGGAAMPAAVMAAFERRFGVPVLEGDGPTECSPVTCVNPLIGERKPGSVGLPVPGVAMCILDADGRPVADDLPGEVCVRGPSVMKGYFNLPEETAAAFFGDWFRTGDLGTRDTDGYFYLVDRIKDLIIVNGMNVYPRVIEEVLYAHPGVMEVAVVGDPDSRHGEVPVAHLVLKPEVALSVAQLRDWCRGRLGRHELPRRYVIHEALPRNAAGKVLKRELRRTGEVERGVAAPPSECRSVTSNTTGVR